MENLYFNCFLIFLSSILPSKKSQTADFEKKFAGINFSRFQVYKIFAEINIRGSRISKNFAKKLSRIRQKTAKTQKFLPAKVSSCKVAWFFVLF